MKTIYTESELDNCAYLDLINDAKHAELQAKTGPFYYTRGITPESLTAYAAQCRQKAENIQGLHKRTVRGA